MKKAINGNLVQFTFDNLANGTPVAPYTMDCSKLTPEILAQCPAFAMSHRLGDNAAIARKAKDGSVITVTEQMRRDAVAELGNFYMNGATSWNVTGGSRAPAQNPMIAELAAEQNVSYAEMEVILVNKYTAEIQSL